MTHAINNSVITTWEQFRTSQQTQPNFKLLANLDHFPDSILITGCQRSGTTILSRIITQSEGMVNYWFGPDDELDAALILSGQIQHIPVGRYCFQTTYLDEAYREYYEHTEFYKMIWMLRNPYSVIYSLLYNWPKHSLDNTFDRLGVDLLDGYRKILYKYSGIRYINRVRRACMVYNAKITQVLELSSRLGAEKIMIVDYDDLVLNKEEIFPKIYQFIDLKYKSEYTKKIHSKSLQKSNLLAKKEARCIKRVSESLYLEARQLATLSENGC